MKLKNIVESIGSLQKLSNLQLKMKLAFRISKFLNETKVVIDLFEEKRNALIKEHGVLQENGSIIVKDDKIEFVNKQIEEVLNEELDITIPEISLSEFGDVEIEPLHLMKLDWFIKE